MNIVKCTNGHFFDSDKYEECPYCAEKGEHVFKERNDLDDQKTIAGNIANDIFFENQLTERYLENVRDDEKTVSLSTASGNNRPVVGWLMCISGSQKGRALSVFFGRNFAGRAKSMDIRFTDDDYISRDNHFSIVYDPKSNKFSLVPGGGETHINNMVVNNVQQLYEDDVIEVGQTKYLFVPYCKEGRTWNEEN